MDDSERFDPPIKKRLPLPFHFVRVEKVIRGYQMKPLAPHHIEQPVASRHNPTVLLPMKLDSFEPFGVPDQKAFDPVRRVVLRSVINNEQLEPGVSLPQDALQAGSNIGLMVIGRNADTMEGERHAILFPLCLFI
ncbi:MAG: hypothetical protein Tsb0017_23800 [Geothermobacteraceae bacterium]